jgi:hypothetical protein
MGVDLGRRDTDSVRYPVFWAQYPGSRMGDTEYWGVEDNLEFLVGDSGIVSKILVFMKMRW